MKIAVCDLCQLEKVDGKKKLVESQYRWGYKGGFKLDLCHFHTKVNNPFKGMSKDAAEKKYWGMMLNKQEAEEIITKANDDLEGRLAHAGDNVPKMGRGGRP